VGENPEDVRVTPPVSQLDVLPQAAFVPHGHLAEDGDGRDVVRVAGGLDPVEINIARTTASASDRV
jgi:hypothetical protein